MTAIGEVRPSTEGLTMSTSGSVAPLTPSARDEIARTFDNDIMKKAVATCAPEGER